jgi:hypothetical protein
MCKRHVDVLLYFPAKPLPQYDVNITIAAAIVVAGSPGPVRLRNSEVWRI